MTFDASEKSRYGGAPVEGFRFTQGGTSWLLTSADSKIVLPAGTFTPAPIKRGSIDLSQEDIAGELEVMLPLTHPLVRMFTGYVPATSVNLVMYRAHRGGESDAVIAFTGVLGSIRCEPSEAKLRFRPISSALQRAIPSLRFQRQCNWSLYGPGCGVSALAFRDAITIATVSGVAVTAPELALRADGWFRNGWLEGANGERRFIVAHTGTGITLMNPYPALAPGQSAFAFAGCDRTEAVCAAKFNNLPNHLGFARIPNRNPHQGSII